MRHRFLYFLFPLESLNKEAIISSGNSKIIKCTYFRKVIINFQVPTTTAENVNCYVQIFPSEYLKARKHLLCILFKINFYVKGFTCPNTICIPRERKPIKHTGAGFYIQFLVYFWWIIKYRNIFKVASFKLIKEIFLSFKYV